MEDNYTGGDICIDGSTDCIGNDIVYGSRTDIHLKKASTEWSGLLVFSIKNVFYTKVFFTKYTFLVAKVRGLPKIAKNCNSKTWNF